MIYLLDTGHSKLPTSQGKRSPVREDGTRFYEYESNRAIAAIVAKKLDALGIEYHYVLNPEKEGFTSLGQRVANANAYAREYGKQNCLFISFHSNAIGNGEEWKDSARGWSIYTSKGTTKSDAYATIFFEEAAKVLPQYGQTVRTDYSDGDPDYEENFTVLSTTICPAVLIEALFYTSRPDLAFLDSHLGREILAQIVVNAIKRIEGF